MVCVLLHHLLTRLLEPEQLDVITVCLRCCCLCSQQTFPLALMKCFANHVDCVLRQQVYCISCF